MMFLLHGKTQAGDQPAWRQHLPRCRAVARQADDGRATIATLQLGNIELRQGDITELGEKDGIFDYIICHGVFSWVPPPVQDKILELCTRNLAPQGVAYVSYNTYPGWPNGTNAS